MFYNWCSVEMRCKQICSDVTTFLIMCLFITLLTKILFMML